MTAATQLRDEGQSATIAADVSVTRDYARFIREAIDGLALAWDEPWTCDNVRQIAATRARNEGRPFDPSPNLLPALIGVAVGKKEIVRQPVDATSSRRSRHAARVGTYLGAKYATTTNEETR